MNGRVILVPCDVIIAMCDVTVGLDIDDCHDNDRDAEQDSSKDKLHLNILAPVSETKKQIFHKYPSSLSHHFSNSIRKRGLGPRLESRSGH